MKPTSLEDNNQLPQFTILAGDTNTTFSMKDKEGGSNKQKHRAINSFLGLQDRFNLQDIFRIKYPESRKYSWECINPTIIRERIDMIFTSQNLQDFVIESDIIPRYKTCSDHGIPFIHIKGFGIPTRGPGVWKFNNALLAENDFVFEMNKNLPIWIAEAKRDIKKSFGDQWGFIKFKIGEFSRKFGARLNKEQRALKNKIEFELNILSSNLNEQNKVQYENLRQQLDDLIKYEVKGSILRSLSQNYEEGEKCSK